jgi:hypothetical protein
MKRIYLLAATLLLILLPVSAQGLRHSVCIVEPEFSEADKTFMGDYAQFMARAGMRSAARTLTAYKSEGTFGSGVVVNHDGKKYVLTNLHVVGYAENATIIFQLHEKTLRYEHCEVVNIASTDLAAVALPAECETISLPIYAGVIEEDVSIVAAGFPELAHKPSWQLTRGIISNAHVDVDSHEHASRIIQHTASIDPGSSGGPLLLKNKDGKYEILGINTWKAFYREGVGLAIGKEDVQSFIATLGTSKTDAGKEMEPLRSLSGEDWLYVFRQLSDSVQKDIRDLDWHLPLDPALRTLAVRDSLVKSKGKGAKKFERSATHIVTDMDNMNHFHLIYDNYLGLNQLVGIQIGHDWLGFITTGLQVTALISETQKSSTPVISAGPLLGVYLGAQLPIQVGKFILAPRITQTAAAGPFFSGASNFNTAITTDTRVGLDWRVPTSGSYDFVLGLHYDMNWLWSKATMTIEPLKTNIGAFGLNQYLQHGVGLTLGVAW